MLSYQSSECYYLAVTSTLTQNLVEIGELKLGFSMSLTCVKMLAYICAVLGSNIASAQNSVTGRN